MTLQLIESGEKERLMDLLRDRLIECGWKDEMKDICRFGNGKLLTYIDLQIDNKMHGAPIVNL